MPRRAGSYLFNTTIAGIEQADLCLLIGTNARFEAPLVNARIRKRWLRGGFTIARIGQPDDLTYPVTELGAGPQGLAEIVDGSHDFCDRLRSAKRAVADRRPGRRRPARRQRNSGGGARDRRRFGMIADDWNGFNVLHTAAARVGGLDLGLVPGKGGANVEGILEGGRQGQDQGRLSAGRR